MLAARHRWSAVSPGFFTFGLAWLSLPIVIPLAVILGYYAITLGSPPPRHRRHADDGYRADADARQSARRPDDPSSMPLVFWITVWIAWPISLVFALFTPRQQMVHDLITGTLMLRRSPMERHWAGHRAAGNQA